MDANELNQRSSPLGYWNLAHDFFEAADIVRKRIEVEVKISSPTYYLYAHAIELTFKAFLRCKGIEVKELKKFGHNLEELLHEAKGKDLATHTQLTLKQTAVIKYINLTYNGKNLEYFIQGVKHLPCLNEVHDTAEALLKSLKPICETWQRDVCRKPWLG